jgi:hypothetical protein
MTISTIGSTSGPEDIPTPPLDTDRVRTIIVERDKPGVRSRNPEGHRAVAHMCSNFGYRGIVLENPAQVIVCIKDVHGHAVARRDLHVYVDSMPYVEVAEVRRDSSDLGLDPETHVIKGVEIILFVNGSKAGNQSVHHII